MSITINLSQYATNADGSKDTRYPDGDRPPGQVELAWDLPDQYTDTSKLFPKTFILRYGTTQGGPYNSAVMLENDTDPAMLRKLVNGLSIGTTYYFVVQTVDSEGFTSAYSSEFSQVAAVAPTVTDPVSYTEIRQVDLPYTISASGNYRIMENISYDVSQGTGITINADDVTLFAAEADNIVTTFGNTNDVIGIGITGARSNLAIHGFHATVGTNNTSSTFSHGLIYFDNLGNAINGLTIRDMEFTVGQSNTNMAGTSTNYGAVVFRSPTGVGVIGDIYDCTFNLRGTKAGSGVRGVSLEAGGSAPNLRVYDNTINCSGCSGTSTGYQRAVQGAHEVYGNTFNINSCVFSAFGLVGVNESDYTHNNTFNVTSSNAVRCVMAENDKANAVHLFNTLNVTSTTGSGDVRLYRCRFGANDNIFGFSTASGNDQSLSLALLDIYGTQVPYGLTRNNYVYRNTASGMQQGLINCQEQAENTYLWSNTADSTNVHGMRLRSIATGENANGFYCDADSISGSTADVRLQTDGLYPACENTHFAGLGALTISNNDPVETAQETDFWLDGDAGLITHTKRNTGSKTPNAPTNLRAA